MVSASLYIGVDVSTTAAKAVIIETDDADYSVIARGQHAFKALQTHADHPGRAEQDPAEWIHGVNVAIGSALEQCDRQRVAGISVSGQQHGLVALDSDHKVIRPAKLWCDVESADEARELSEKFDYELVPGFTASKILWLKRKEPEHFARLRHVLLPHDYINFYLTGRMVMECGDASGTGVFDVEKRCFRREHMDVIDEGLHRAFPELIGPNEVIGTLTEAAAADLGLPTTVVVAPGTGDNAASALGNGAVSSGTLVCSLGTSGTLFGVSNTPVSDATGQLAPFCDATGKWLPLLCIQNCGGVADEVCRAFESSQEQLTTLAACEPPGCEGVNFLPYLNGERCPNWPHARASILGLSPGSMRPGLLYRAALEGATFSLYAGMVLLQQHGAAAAELRLCGGGSKNLLWQQIVADVFQLPVVLPAETESAALGVALQAAAVHRGIPVDDFISTMKTPVAKVVQPNRANAAMYGKAFQRHQTLGERLFKA